jgi:hypothetical protein
MGLAARRPLAVGLGVGVLALAGGVLALRLQATAATETLVGSDSPSARATDRLRQRFGEEPVYVLVREPVTQLVLTSDLGRVLGLEGCLSGNVPAGRRPPGGGGGPCAALARTRSVRVVFGPGTFLNEAVGRIQDELRARTRQTQAQGDRAARAARALARAQGRSPAQARRLGAEARRLVQARATRDLLVLALHYGLSSAPRLDDPQFVSRVVFDDARGPGVPKARFAYLFPNKDAALVQVRLRPGLGEAARRDAIAQIRRAVAMPQWRLPNGKGSYVVTGAPVVVSDLSSSLPRSIAVLLAVAVAVMALTLALVFRARLALLPLVVALAAAGLTLGGLSAVGASLTIASIAVAPILLGLAVDYAIQLQARVQEEEREGEPLTAAVARTAARGAPAVVVAATATAAGFAVLVLSPVPMVRGFGALLVAGIAVALACALTLGIAALSGAARRSARRASGLGEAAGAALRGARELVVANPVARSAGAGARAAGRAALRGALAHPGRLVLAALALAAVGWALDTRASVESDITKLVPQDRSVRDLQALQRATGVAGEVDVLVSGPRVADPDVVRWMTRYQAALLRRFGYSEARGCGRAELCPAFSLPDLFRGAGTATAARIDALLDAVPPYFSQGVITRDRRTATLAFGIRLEPLERQFAVMRAMRRSLRPPPGVRAELAGLPVLAAEANDAIAAPWRRIAGVGAGLVAVALVLLFALRSARRALVPLVPIALAGGWSALVLFALRIPLNPMSVVLGALVVAITTEFSVLLSERYAAERASGRAPRAALERTYRSTGAAVLASGTTAIAGFAVLVVSDVRMLREFGLVTVVDLTVALAGVMIVLPAVLVLAERGARVAVRRRRRERAEVA